MKNTMKKLMSLLLVMVMLVSVAPFAHAEEGIDGQATVEQPNGVFSVKKDDGTPLNNGSATISYPQSIKDLVTEGNDLDKYYLVGWTASWMSTAYSVPGAALQGSSLNDTVYPGMDVKITLGERTQKNSITLIITGADTAAYYNLSVAPGTTLESVYNQHYTKQGTYIPTSWETNDNLYSAASQVTNNTTTITVTVNTRVNTSVPGGDASTGKPQDKPNTTPVDDASTGKTDGTPSTTKNITYTIRIGDSSTNYSVAATGAFAPSNGTSAVVSDILTYKWNQGWKNTYDFAAAWDNTAGAAVAENGSVPAGHDVTIRVKAKSGSSNGTTDGDKLNVGGSTSTNKFPYNVYLHVYLNNQVGTPHKTLDITNGIALDGKVTMAEVKSLLLNYYSAKDSNGIAVDGMYMARGNWVSKFANDTQKYSTIEGLDEARKDSEIHINIMLTNASVKNSNADPDNPKTGDSMNMVFTVLGLSSAALAVAYVYGKKRALI